MRGHHDGYGVAFQGGDMTTEPLVIIAISHPKLVDELLSELDGIARAYDHYEYGLPLHGEDTKAQLRECVYRWLLRISQPPNTGCT